MRNNSTWDDVFDTQVVMIEGVVACLLAPVLRLGLLYGHLTYDETLCISMILLLMIFIPILAWLADGTEHRFVVRQAGVMIFAVRLDDAMIHP